MLRLYDNHLSGNGYKPRLLLAHLGRTYERIEVDILKGETRTPEFLAKNPNAESRSWSLRTAPVLPSRTRFCAIWRRARPFFRPTP